MPGMKLTPNTAMRARDVSRPRAEHLAEAEAAEAKGGVSREWRGGPERGDAALAGEGSDRTGGGPEPGAAGAGDRSGRQGLPRRRRGARDGGRRGRSSR